MKKAKDFIEAMEIQEKFKGEPHGIIQWKGTDVCMDVHCKCGHLGHIDTDFAYQIKCKECGRVYFTSSIVELIELEAADTTYVEPILTD